MQRQPFGGWKRSSVGAGTKAGGPNYLIGLGSWRSATGGAPSSTLHLRGLDTRITSLIEAAQPSLDYEAFEPMAAGVLGQIADEIEERGPIRLAEVIDAQKLIIATARRMADAGTIMLGGKGNDFV